MKTGTFGNKYKGIMCKNASGNGARQLYCKIDNRPCPYQHFCTNKRIYENVPKFTSCSKQK